MDIFFNSIKVHYTPLSPYAAIGIDGFFEKYDEILDYFGKKKKKFDTFVLQIGHISPSN